MADTAHEPRLERSEFSGEFTDAGMAVTLDIFRPDGSQADWTMEVRDQNGGLTAWEAGFATDRDAFDEFLATIQRDGIRTFLDDVDPQVH